ncbi:MAG: hypothetical protein EOM90_04685 [Alphaproteobacteria bacterium]|nr:hypothetical protein [Alphaproteobacteria bacterium]
MIPTIQFPQCDGNTVNPKIIRLHCLTLAHFDDICVEKIELAKEYADWVFSGVISKKYLKSMVPPSVLEDLRNSGKHDDRFVENPSWREVAKEIIKEPH